jgi:hypothetical protein
MLASDLLSEEDVAAMLAEAGVADTSKIDREAFERFVDEMVEEEDYDDDEDEDEDE